MGGMIAASSTCVPWIGAKGEGICSVGLHRSDYTGRDGLGGAS